MHLRIFDKQKPRVRDAYAVEHGEYVGEFFVFIEQLKDTYYFLSLPKMEQREVPVKDFKIALDDKIISFVERIPNRVYKICYAKYRQVKLQPKKKQSEDINNRHKQSSVSNLSHNSAK